MIPPTEPSNDIRQFTSLVRQFYIGLVEQGFTPDEAMTLTKAWLTGVAQR